MRLGEAKSCIKELYTHTSEVTALIGERGVGKTSAYKQCAEELGIGYMALYAAALEGPDFMGLPDNLNYTVNALDDALIDRFISLEIIADIEDYTHYSIETGSHDSVLAYLNACPDRLLITKEHAESDPLSKYPTPQRAFFIFLRKLLRRPAS